jgi:hypothetical protein
MNWQDLGGSLIRAGAPIIGTALGGPIGGAIGGALGGVLASALGTEPTPEAVSEAIATGNPADIQARLTAADNEAAAKWQAIVGIAQAEAQDRSAQSAAINETMREENGKVSWYHWRHLLGYAVLAWVVCPLPIILFYMLKGDVTLLNGIVAAVVSLIPLIAIAAALNGYVASDTTRLKSIAMTGEPQPTVTGAIAKAIVTKRK